MRQQAILGEDDVEFARDDLASEGAGSGRDWVEQTDGEHARIALRRQVGDYRVGAVEDQGEPGRAGNAHLEQTAEWGEDRVEIHLQDGRDVAPKRIASRVATPRALRPCDELTVRECRRMS